MPQEIRVALAGDAGVGKTSLVMALLRGGFVNNVQSVAPEVTLPSDASPTGVTTKVVDLGNGVRHQERMETELRRAHAVVLVYSVLDPDSLERISTYWIPMMHSLGINVPVVLAGNKVDLYQDEDIEDALEDEMAQLMSEFKEIETCLECSASEFLNVGEVFYYAQKAVLYPTAPLYDARTHSLKPACADAFRNIFILCDTNKDGVLGDDELNDFQYICFGAPLQVQELEGIRELVRMGSDSAKSTFLKNGGLTLNGFLYLHTLFIQRGRLETAWTALWTFGYGMDLALSQNYVHPPLRVPEDMYVELSPAGYQFLTEIFKSHDKDHDGALNARELEALFATAPNGEHPWTSTLFPTSTVTNDAGAVTLQGWLAQWSMTTLVEPRTTLAYLAYLGYPLFAKTMHLDDKTQRSSPPSPTYQSTGPSSYAWLDGTAVGAQPAYEAQPALTRSALKFVRPRRPGDRRRSGQEQCSVFLALVLGAPGSGKTALLRNLVGKPFQAGYTPTRHLQRAVGAVEQGGAERYVVLQEFGSQYEAEALRQPSTLEHVSVILFVYDSSDTHSFSYISNLRQQFPHLATFPTLFVATKSDLDLARQRHEVQPDVYCRKLGLSIPHLGAGPINVSARWGEVAQLYTVLVSVASDPKGAVPAPTRSLSAVRLRWRTSMLYMATLGGTTAAIWMAVRWLGLPRSWPNWTFSSSARPWSWLSQGWSSATAAAAAAASSASRLRADL